MSATRKKIYLVTVEDGTVSVEPFQKAPSKGRRVAKSVEDIDREWEEFRAAKGKRKWLRNYIRHWNRRAHLLWELQQVEKHLKRAADEIPFREKLGRPA